MIILEPVSAFLSGVLVSSNVPEAEHPIYSASTTYVANAMVIDPANPLIFKSIADGNVGNSLTDQTKWQVVGYTNRMRMFDAYNSTLTSQAESIVVSLSPKLISQGIYLGNLDANEVVLTVTDAIEGVVYSETRSLIVSDSKSSFFNWCFKRIRRQTYFFTALLPVYANSVATIAINKPGGVAACGMCCIGPLVDAGLSEYGLSREIKDYSTTKFNFDGTNDSIVRGFAKRMSLDIEVANENIDAVLEQLEAYRQSAVVFVGTVLYGSAIVYGKYSGWKSVIAGKVKSKLAMQIEGMI